MVLEHGKEHASQGGVSDDMEIAVVNERRRQRRTGQTAMDVHVGLMCPRTICRSRNGMTW